MNAAAFAEYLLRANLPSACKLQEMINHLLTFGEGHIHCFTNLLLVYGVNYLERRYQKMAGLFSFDKAR